jgi:hypothetical protein
MDDGGSLPGRPLILRPVAVESSILLAATRDNQNIRSLANAH